MKVQKKIIRSHISMTSETKKRINFYGNFVNLLSEADERILPEKSCNKKNNMFCQKIEQNLKSES